MEYFTVANAALALSILGNAFLGLKWLAPQTATTADDKAVAAIERAKQWAAQWAPTFWMFVEAAARSGNLPSGASKSTEFIIKLREAFKAEHGKELPAEAEAVAKNVATNISAGDKLARLDPRCAPPAVEVTR